MSLKDKVLDHEQSIREKALATLQSDVLAISGLHKPEGVRQRVTLVELDILIEDAFTRRGRGADDSAVRCFSNYIENQHQLKYYTEQGEEEVLKARLNWLKELVNFYGQILSQNGQKLTKKPVDSYEEAVLLEYKTRDNYIAALNVISEAAQRYNQLVEDECREGPDLAVRYSELIQELRTKEAKNIFPDALVIESESPGGEDVTQEVIAPIKKFPIGRGQL